MAGTEKGQLSGVHRGPLDARCAHVCCDMQRMFAEKTDWHTPWMPPIIPLAHRLAAAHPGRTIFTRFLPAARPGEGKGTWRSYFERWQTMTLERLGSEMIELVPELAALTPPAEVVDKHVYSPWLESQLPVRLDALQATTLVVSGGETDVCVLATVLGAIDRGYRVVLAADAICSSADDTHDASLRIYNDRYGMQVETATTTDILEAWRV
jgi:nicotinamidase-related amidase